MKVTMKETLAFIWSLLRPHKRAVVLSAVLATTAAALTTIGPILMGRGFDYAGAGKGVAWYGGALALWFATRFIANRLRAYVAYRGSLISGGAVESFLRSTYSELLEYPLSFHYGSSGRKVRERVSGSQWGVMNFINNLVFDVVPALLTILAVLTYLFFLDVLIGAVLLASMAAFILYTWRKSGEMRRLRWKWNDKLNEMTTRGWDACQNILIVKSTNGERQVERQLNRKGKAFLDFNIKDSRFNRGFRNNQDIIMLLGSTAIVLIAVMRFSSGAFTFGMLSAVTAYAFTIFGYVTFIQWSFIQFIRIQSDREMLSELLDVPKEPYSEGKSVALSGGVEFRNVRFRYREARPALEDVSFSAENGQRIAIVGESGEGKTTLVDLMGRYYLPQSGAILFDGIDSKDINLTSLRSQMAYVPQDLTLFHDTIKANIRFGHPRASENELREAVRLAHLDRFVASLPKGLKTVVGARGLKLSGGERQRVALARAFLRNPKILILDEPTSNLDSKTEAFIQDSLSKLMQGRTTFIIAHRLKTVMSADKILVLKSGRIVQEGTHEELLSKPGAYTELLMAQGGFIAPGECRS